LLQVLGRFLGFSLKRREFRLSEPNVVSQVFARLHLAWRSLKWTDFSEFWATIWMLA